MIHKGEIYLARLDGVKTYNFSKTRPVIVFQNDWLNRAIDDSLYADLIIIPLSTKLLGGTFRYRLAPRESLRQESEAVCNALCTINIERIDLDTGVIAQLDDREIRDIGTILAEVLALFDPMHS